MITGTTGRCHIPMLFLQLLQSLEAHVLTHPIAAVVVVETGALVVMDREIGPMIVVDGCLTAPYINIVATTINHPPDGVFIFTRQLMWDLINNISRPTCFVHLLNTIFTPTGPRTQSNELLHHNNLFNIKVGQSNLNKPFLYFSKLTSAHPIMPVVQPICSFSILRPGHNSPTL